jgi:hypothetical protein
LVFLIAFQTPDSIIPLAEQTPLMFLVGVIEMVQCSTLRTRHSSAC